MLNTTEIINRYGKPDINGRYLTMITLPYPMRLAWDKKTTVIRLRCHKLISTQLQNVFNEVLEVYGYDRIKELGIDLFGGCFEFRQMRGGSDYSRHSWGIAIDLDPERNGLKTKWDRAQFSKKEYEPMIQIFYKNGFKNLGKEKGYDAMHFEYYGN